jgi:hypothetical protein
LHQGSAPHGGGKALPVAEVMVTLLMPPIAAIVTNNA